MSISQSSWLSYDLIMRIEILSSGPLPVSYEIHKDKISLGHDPSCDFLLPEPEISRLHLDIITYEGRYFIQDNGSTNGTYLDDKKVEPGSTIEVFEGTQLRLGASVILTFTNKKTSAQYFPTKMNEPIEKTKVISLAKLQNIKNKSVLKKRSNIAALIIAMAGLPYLAWAVINNL